MTVKRLERIFDPKSIAVIGASDDENTVGYGVFKNLKKGYKGKLYPVNIKRRKIQGKKAFKEILDIPKEIDIAIIATPASTVLSLVKNCCKKKVKAVVIMSSGFLEAGEKGRKLAEEILKVARKSRVRIMGPNCMGFLNPYKNLNASFADSMPPKGRTAFISQSGAMGSATLDWAIRHKMGLSFFASIGSMIDIGFSELIDYLGQDPNTQSIVIYMESLKDVRKFMSAARSFSLDKPIIVLKSGKSPEGAVAAMSHTGNLAGNDAVFDAAFNRAGIVRVNESDDLFDCAEALSKQKRPTGNRLAIVTNAGGPGVLSTDVLVERGGVISKLSKKTIEKLNSFLPSAWSHSNPVDILGDADEIKYKKAVEACLEDNSVDGVLVLLTPQTMTNAEKIAKEITSIKTDKPILASFMGGYKVEKAKKILGAGKIPNFPYPERAVKAFIYLYDYSKHIKNLYEAPGTIPGSFNPDVESSKKIIEKAVLNKRYTLSEDESKKFLKNYEIPITEDYVCKNPEQALKISKKLGYPTAMKVSSPSILHKTDIGAVKLNINSDSEVKKTFSEIMKNSRKHYPKAKIDGISISKMVNKRYELIIGCKKDPIFGPVIAFGMGGVAVNVFKDIKIGLPPLNMNLARGLIKETKIYELLKGYRGIPGVNIDELAFTLYKFAYMITDFPEIKEVDINPYTVDENGGISIDSKIVLDKDYIYSKSTKEPYSHLVIHPYPKELIKELKMRNGNPVIFRPIRPEDEDLEAEIFKHLSKKTQRFRFFGLIKEVNHEMLVRYTHNDYDREMGIMAEIKEKGEKKMIGVCRIIKNPYDDSAEFAIVVADPWQKLGVGNQLTDYVLEIAKKRKIRKIYAYFLEDNDIMRHMLEKRGFEFTKEDDMFVAKKRI